MSFRIHSPIAAACSTLGTQERQAHDQRHLHESSKGVTPCALHDELLNGWSSQAKSSMAIRRAQDCQSVLGDALGLLQTQDEALARLQNLSPAAPPDEAKSIGTESFNGLPVFSQTPHPDPIWIENIETPEAVEVPRPPVLFWLRGDPASLAARLAEAHDANRRAQLHIEGVLETNRVQLLEAELAPHQITRREDAVPCLEISRAVFLAYPREVLAIQANSSQESLLRLFQ